MSPDLREQMPEEAPPGPGEGASLTRAALGGVAWNWSGAVVLVVTQVISTAVTARLVAPAEFGVYATAQAASGLAGYFTLAAVGQGLQRRSTLTADAIGSALLLSMGASALVAVVVWIAAPFWGDAWDVSNATPTIRALAVALCLTATAAVPMALIRRRLRFRTAALIETSAMVLGIAAGIALAIELHSAFALALGQAVGAAVLLLSTGLLARRELTIRFRWSDGRELLTFASQVGALGFAAYLINSAPAWFAARVFGPAALGLYSRATLIVALPGEYALTSIGKVLYPLYGRVRDDLTKTKALVAEALALTTGALWPCLAVIGGGATVVVAALLGDRWEDAAPLLSASVFVVAAWIACGLLTNAAEALGWMRVIANRQGALLAGIAISLGVVYVADLSLTWAVGGVAVSEWMVYLLTVHLFVRREFLDARVTLRVQGLHGATALLIFAAAAGSAAALEATPLIVQVLGQLVVAFTAFVAMLLGRSWYPATQVLARRIGVGPDESVLRAVRAALR